MKYVLCLILFVFSIHGGAAMSLKNKEKSQTTGEIIRASNSQQQQVDHAVEGQPTPAPNLNVNGTNNVTTVEIYGNPEYKQSTSVGSQSSVRTSEDREEFSFSKSKFPVWVAMIGFAVGVFLLLLALQYARKQSRAVDAAYSAADGTIGKWINEARERAATSNDPSEMARLNAEIAAMNEERGKLKMTRYTK